MTDTVKYAVERAAGVPYMLVRLRWPDIAESINPHDVTWKPDYALFDKLYNSDGELISAGDALRLAQSWGGTLPDDSVKGVMAKWGDSWETQERGYHGRWGSSTGGSQSDAKGNPVSLHAVGTGAGGAARPGMGDIPLTPKLLEDLSKPGTSSAPYITADGHFTPERQALHDRIVNESLAGTTPVEHPQLIMLGGGPGSGKTSVISNGTVDVPENIVHNDPDAIKNEFPEVIAMRAADDRTWAGVSHEESSYVSARITAASYETQRNMMLDSTGDSSIEKLSGKIDAAHAAGFTVTGAYVSVDPESGLERAVARGDVPGGRVVPEGVVRDTYRSLSETVPQSYGKFDSVQLFDNNGPKGSTPSLILSAENGNVTIHDQAAYDRFLSAAVKKGLLAKWGDSWQTQERAADGRFGSGSGDKTVTANATSIFGSTPRAPSQATEPIPAGWHEESRANGRIVMKSDAGNRAVFSTRSQGWKPGETLSNSMLRSVDRNGTGITVDFAPKDKCGRDVLAFTRPNDASTISMGRYGLASDELERGLQNYKDSFAATGTDVSNLSRDELIRGANARDAALSIGADQTRDMYTTNAPFRGPEAMADATLTHEMGHLAFNGLGSSGDVAVMFSGLAAASGRDQSVFEQDHNREVRMSVVTLNPRIATFDLGDGMKIERDQIEDFMSRTGHPRLGTETASALKEMGMTRYGRQSLQEALAEGHAMYSMPQFENTPMVTAMATALGWDQAKKALPMTTVTKTQDADSDTTAKVLVVDGPDGGGLMIGDEIYQNGSWQQVPLVDPNE